MEETINNFPFDEVDSNNLNPGETYYMQLNNDIINKELNIIKRKPKLTLPVSKLQGDFVRLETKSNNITSTDYAVFKNVYIMNHNYKPGSCRYMFVLYPEGFVAMDDCDKFSDKNNGRTVNLNREVYLPLNRWKFGIPTERVLVSKMAFEKISTKLDPDTEGIVKSMYGKGIKSKKRRKRKNKSRVKKTRKYRYYKI